jgi:hypothetical protein
MCSYQKGGGEEKRGFVYASELPELTQATVTASHV